MRALAQVLSLVLYLSACGEDAPEPCVSGAECPSGWLCTDGVCMPGRIMDATVDSAVACTDRDGDGYGDGPDCIAPDCDDTDADAYPNAEEICDGDDDDCDDAVDEGIDDLACGLGPCAVVVPGCVDGALNVCVPAPSRGELCDNDFDDDCDGRTDEGFDDHFDEATIGPDWVNGDLGSPITFSIADSFLRVDSAPYASTPSRPGTSWVYETDRDFGNQMAIARSVGRGDFDVIADIDWTSTGPELTLAGVALTNAVGNLELMLGYADGSSSASGGVRVNVRMPGTDGGHGAAPAASGTATLHATRTDGMVTVYLDGTEVVAATPFTADIQHLAIYAVAHRNGATTYTFGGFGLDRVRLCH